jgi:hypothetical protein
MLNFVRIILLLGIGIDQLAVIYVFLLAELFNLYVLVVLLGVPDLTFLNDVWVGDVFLLLDYHQHFLEAVWTAVLIALLALVICKARR